MDDGAATLRAIAKLFGPTIAAVPHPAHTDERLTSYAAGVAFASVGTALRRLIFHPSSTQPLGAALFSAALSTPRRLEDGCLDSVVITVRLGAMFPITIRCVPPHNSDPRLDLTALMLRADT